MQDSHTHAWKYTLTHAPSIHTHILAHPEMQTKITALPNYLLGAKTYHKLSRRVVGFSWKRFRWKGICLNHFGIAFVGIPFCFTLDFVEIAFDGITFVAVSIVGYCFTSCTVKYQVSAQYRVNAHPLLSPQTVHRGHSVPSKCPPPTSEN